MPPGDDSIDDTMALIEDLADGTLDNPRPRRRRRQVVGAASAGIIALAGVLVVQRGEQAPPAPEAVVASPPTFTRAAVKQQPLGKQVRTTLTYSLGGADAQPAVVAVCRADGKWHQAQKITLTPGRRTVTLARPGGFRAVVRLSRYPTVALSLDQGLLFRQNTKPCSPLGR